METTEKKNELKPTRKCENPTCGKEFTAKNSRRKYCSASCNAKASAIRSGSNFNALQGMNMPHTPQSFAGIAGLGGVFAIPPHAQMMINHHEGESKRWEKKFDAELAEHKETKKELDAVRAQAKEEKNPGGLQGFAERNPEIASKLIDFGSVLAMKFGDKVVTPGIKNAVPELAGLEGQAGEMVKVFAQWLPKLSEKSQGNIWNLITLLSKEDEEKMNYAIQHIFQIWRK